MGCVLLTSGQNVDSLSALCTVHIGVTQPEKPTDEAIYVYRFALFKADPTIYSLTCLKIHIECIKPIIHVFYVCFDGQSWLNLRQDRKEL